MQNIFLHMQNNFIGSFHVYIKINYEEKTNNTTKCLIRPGLMPIRLVVPFGVNSRIADTYHYSHTLYDFFSRRKHGREWIIIFVGSLNLWNCLTNPQPPYYLSSLFMIFIRHPLGKYSKLPRIQKEPEIKWPVFLFGKLRSKKKRETRNQNEKLLPLSAGQRLLHILLTTVNYLR